ncbi:MAG: metallophosphoesterase [Planctomycetes bacterium]|nr:metallophosphoesterase [Planctomycetota bacterium]
MTTLRLLAVGDIHLGRTPGSVPKDVAATRAERDALGPREAWRRTVEAAIEERAQAVLLLGDVVDDEERYLEGWGPLRSGVERLLAHEIQVFAVAGNHDVRILPQLARDVPGLRLVGADGHWEAVDLAGAAARVVGWSYPRAHVRADPTLDAALDELCRARTMGPTIGLIHGDLDASHSEYARFSRARLSTVGADLWLLGHVHVPSFGAARAGSVPLGYLGSLTGLDPTETGVHGPWLLEFEGRALTAARQLPLAPLRWERLDVPVDGWRSIADLQPGIARAIAGFDERERSNLGAARAVGLRLALTGRSPVHRELRRELERSDFGDFRPSIGTCITFVDAVVDEARPDFDLVELARGTDPAGLLAQRILALDAPDGPLRAERSRLLRLARATRQGVSERREFLAVREPEPSDELLAAELRAAGLQALEELLAARAEGAERP